MIWPLLLWLAYKFKFNSLLILIIIFLISFLLNLNEVVHDSIASFYLPYTRFWELASGSILAYFTYYKITFENIFLLKTLHKINIKNLPNIISFIGLIVLLYGIYKIDKNLPFPGKWALIPVLGTVFIIWAGSKAWINKYILSNKLLVWFGLISFPLYLWHWVIFSFQRIVDGLNANTIDQFLLIFLSIFLAWLTFKFIELPIRKKYDKVFIPITLIIIMMIIGFCGYITYKNNGFQKFDYPIRSLLPDDLIEHKKCLKLNNLENENIRYCRISGNNPRIAIIGDSHGAALYEALSDSLHEYNDDLLMIGGRLYVNIAYYPEGNEFEINNYKGGIIATKFVANEKSIQTVIMVSRGPNLLYTPNKLYLLNNLDITNRKKILELGIRETLNLLIKNNKNVIFVLDNPEILNVNEEVLDKMPSEILNDSNSYFNPNSCKKDRVLSFFNNNSKCLTPKKVFEKIHSEYREIVFEVLKDYPNVKIFDPSTILCDKNFCYARKNDKILYGDFNHLTYDGAKLISSELVNIINDLK